MFVYHKIRFHPEELTKKNKSRLPITHSSFYPRRTRFAVRNILCAKTGMVNSVGRFVTPKSRRKKERTKNNNKIQKQSRPAHHLPTANIRLIRPFPLASGLLLVPFRRHIPASYCYCITFSLAQQAYNFTFISRNGLSLSHTEIAELQSKINKTKWKKTRFTI